ELRATEDALRTSERRREAEQVRAQRMYELAAEYEQERKDAQAVADRTIADLRAGNVRLREQWRGCPEPHMPGLDASAGEPDAAERDREESAGGIVRAAVECDAQVRGLQGVIREYLSVAPADRWDRGLAVPPGATVRTGYVPVHDVRLACKARMAVGDVEAAYRRRIGCAP